MRSSLAVAVAASLASGAALAQVAPTSSSGLEEIVVTAQRRVESLQKVPVAVSAFSAEEITSRQLLSTVDLARTIRDRAPLGGCLEGGESHGRILIG